MNTSPQSTESPYLYESAQQAHDDLMMIAREVIREIRAAGGKVPPVGKMSRDLDKLWAVWRLFADPRGSHETRARLDNR